MDLQSAEPDSRNVKAAAQPAELDRPSASTDAARDAAGAVVGAAALSPSNAEEHSQRVETGAQPLGAQPLGRVDALDPLDFVNMIDTGQVDTNELDAGQLDATLVDAWPELGVSIWPRHARRLPLLPPLPEAERTPALGWIQEWPVSWLRDNPVRRITLRPRSATQPRVPRADQRTTRPALPSRPARPSIPQAPRVLSQRPDPSGASRPIGRRGRRGRPYVILALLLLVALTGASVLTTVNGSLDLAAPLDQLPPIGAFIRDAVGQSSETATAAPVLNPPALGSKAGAFAGVFGASDPTANATATAEYRTQIAGRLVDVRVQFGLGVDRYERVVMIGASDPALQGWQPATADTICATFLPRDAQLRSFVHVSGQTEYIYDSASLAMFFSPASFVDDSGNPITRGAFSRLDQSEPIAASGISSCTLALGQHYQ